MGRINLGRVRGEPFTFKDFTPEQLKQLKGEPGKKGDPGPQGPTMPISDSVASQDSGVAASSKAVKTAYDKAVALVASLPAAAPATATLTDAAGAATLPATTSSTPAALLQTVRNCLKWILALFPVSVANGGTGATTVEGIIQMLYKPGGSRSNPGHVLSFGAGGESSGFSTPLQLRNAMGLGNTTSPLQVANGGTGASTVEGIIQMLCTPGGSRADPGHVLSFGGGGKSSGFSTPLQLRNAMGLGNTTGVLPISVGGTGRTTGASPLPTGAGGVGQWRLLERSNSLPGGGTWAYFGWGEAGTSDAPRTTHSAGVGAGGSRLPTGGIYLCWRIA